MSSARSDPPWWAGRRSAILARVTALLAFLILSLLVTTIGRHQRSGWILITSPFEQWSRLNSLLGYSYLHGGEPFMKENIPSVSQIAFFSGDPTALETSEFRQDFRLLRSFYTFTASLLAPLAGPIGSMLCLNWLGWALAAWVAWRWTIDLYKDEWAAALAVMWVAGGIGMSVHIADYSPHVWAFTSYYLGAWGLYRAGLPEARLALRQHLFIGVLLALASLLYNTGVMLAAAYFLLAVGRNRSWHIGLALGLTFAMRPLFHALTGGAVSDVEGQLLAGALADWYRLWVPPSLWTIKRTAIWLVEFTGFDSPLVLLLGGAACLWASPPPLRWRFGGVILAIPLLAGVLFAPVASARGYLIYGTTVWLYVCLSGAAGRILRGSKVGRRRWLSLGLFLLIVSHVAWSTAHLGFFLFPAKTFFLGWDDSWPYLLSSAPEVLSMTGLEPTPILFGGTATLQEAGAYVLPEERPLPPLAWPVALRTRSGFVLGLVLAGLLAPFSRRVRLALIAAILGGWLGGTGLAVMTLSSWPAFFAVDEAIVLRAGETLDYEVTLAEEFVAELERRTARGDRLQFALFGQPLRALDVTLTAGGQVLPLHVGQQGDWPLFLVPPEQVHAVFERLEKSPRIDVRLHNPGPAPAKLLGWQRAGLAGRHARRSSSAASPQPPSPVLPAWEMRLLSPQDQIKFAGF